MRTINKTEPRTPSSYSRVMNDCEYTNIISITDLLNNIGRIQSEELPQEIRKKCDEASRAIYDQAENFIYHTTIDDYIYRVKDADGKILFIHYIGQTAYQYYIKNEEAHSIERYTKELFYTVEPLLTKEAVVS